MKNYNITIPATKEERVARFRAMVERSIRIKKELQIYFKEHGTTVGYEPSR